MSDEKNFFAEVVLDPTTFSSVKIEKNLSAPIPQAQSASIPQTQPDYGKAALELASVLAIAQTKIEGMNKCISSFEEVERGVEEKLKLCESNLEKSNASLNLCKKILTKESKLYDILLIVSWACLIIGILSFFVIPVAAFIVIFFVDRNFVVSSFSSFLTLWTPYFIFAFGVIITGGVANLNRVMRNLKADLEKHEAKSAANDS